MTYSTPSRQDPMFRLSGRAGIILVSFPAYLQRQHCQETSGNQEASVGRINISCQWSNKDYAFMCRHRLVWWRVNVVYTRISRVLELRGVTTNPFVTYHGLSKVNKAKTMARDDEDSRWFNHLCLLRDPHKMVLPRRHDPACLCQVPRNLSVDR